MKLCQQTRSAKLRLPISRRSQKRVCVADGGASKGKHVTRLPFKQLSEETAEADTCDEFKMLLMSVDKTVDDRNVSAFADKDMKGFKEEGMKANTPP